MTGLDWIRLISLAAIWGGSFALLKVAAPVLGAVPVACLRVLISGAALFFWFLATRTPIQLKQNIKHYLMMGITNAAIPFLCFSFAALHIPAGLSVILNSTSPLFAIVFASIFLSDPLTIKKVLGFMLGLAGVALIAIRGAFHFDEYSWYAIAGCLFAAIAYASGGVYLRSVSIKSPGQLNQVVLTGVSQLIGGLLLLPFALLQVSAHPIDPAQITLPVVLSVLTLAFVCSSLAFIVFYKMIAQSGTSIAFAVGYLMPVFGILWGTLFLNERITLPMVFGGALIFLGVYYANSRKNIST